MARSSMALLAFVALAIAPLYAQAQCTMSILDAVNATPELSLLGAVVDAAGLSETLSDKTLKVTVFAPNNAAFEELLMVLNSSGLTLGDVTGPMSNKAASILLYHVVPAVATAADLMDGQVLPTLLEGKTLMVKLGMGVEIIAVKSMAMVVTADIMVCDSIVHIVDHVLIPADLADIPNYMPAPGAGMPMPPMPPMGEEPMPPMPPMGEVLMPAMPPMGEEPMPPMHPAPEMMTAPPPPDCKD